MARPKVEQESRKDIEDREKLLTNWAWFKFRQKYPDEKACCDSLFQYFFEIELVKCHHCNSAEVERIDVRTVRCKDCRKSSWFTAGTFFDHTKKLRALLGAIWLWESGVNCSTNYFAKLANIATSTAAGLIKKLAMVINEQIVIFGVELTSREFMRIFLRRSRMTPAKEHPSFEQHAFEEEQRKRCLEEREKQNAENSAGQSHLSSNDLKLYSTLKDFPQNFDQLVESSQIQPNELSSSLLTLQMHNFAKLMPGETYVRVAAETLEPGPRRKVPEGFNRKKTEKSMHDYFKLTKNGISRKDFQLYSAKYWTTADRERWGPGKILALCSQAKPVIHDAIRSFITPLFVYVSPVIADRIFAVSKESKRN